MSIKKLIPAICMLAVALPSGAKTLSYAYDNSGNRVAREIVVNTTKAPMKTAGETVSELLSQKEVRVHTEIGRLYDPALGRFLSPDPYVQIPESSQNFNRYTYALNNPLKYNDPNGEFFLTTIISFYLDLFDNFIHRPLNFGHYKWSYTARSLKIKSGMFRGNLGQIVSKWTWGITNSILGNLVGDGLNIFGRIKNVTYLDGMAALEFPRGDENSAFTIGHISIGPKGYVADWRDHLFVHEYGHYVQAQRMGPLYLPVVAIPSVISFKIAEPIFGIKHDMRWFEMNASRLGAKHFDEKYGSGAEGYKPNDPNYFDREKFVNGKRTSYQNPRYTNPDEYGWQGGANPVSGSKFYIWDLII